MGHWPITHKFGGGFFNFSGGLKNISRISDYNNNNQSRPENLMETYE